MDEKARQESNRLFELPALVDRRTSDRKRRLFAVACLRRFLERLSDPRSVRAVMVAERLALGLASEAQRQQAEDAAFEAHAEMREGRFGGDTLVPWSWQAEQLTRAAALVVSCGLYYAEDAADYARRSLAAGLAAEEEEETEQCRLLIDIAGPAAPVLIDPFWLAQNDGAVALLARLIDDEQAFDLLPVLADALEDAGCTNAEILGHCRGPGPHVRGCWLIDLLTATEA